MMPRDPKNDDKEKAAKKFKKIDTNENGKISKEEFQKYENGDE